MEYGLEAVYSVKNKQIYGMAVLFWSLVKPGKELAWQCRRCRFDPWVGKIPWRRPWQPTPEFLPGGFHGQRSLASYNPWVAKGLDMI